MWPRHLKKDDDRLRRHGLVGVVTDEDAVSYKRQPECSHKEREEVISAYRYVDEVVTDPLVITADFLAAHGIDFVVHAESDTSQDAFFATPREAR